ncbi:porin family protein [Flavobacterium sp. '19STA2R22 D10 B1']|uniref:porin family protein n=1 Tax=Flavobacterium aerium TaxID=3037261 RepID=UPI00278C54BE|nr:porin family protein [Flavobacterium sp. '19STA2R22 D10 B1']
MKKITLLITLLGLFATGFAQETATPKTNGTSLFGFSTGANLSNIRGNKVAEENNSALDFLVGLSYEYQFTESFALKTELNYERKSFKKDAFLDATSSRRYELKTTLNYITIPILAKYSFGNNKNFFINSGPFMGNFIDDTFKIDGKNFDAGGTIFKNIDFGWAFGAGTSIKLNKTNNLNIEIRNNLGLSNISKLRTINNGSVKTNSINLIVNWNFNI